MKKLLLLVLLPSLFIISGRTSAQTYPIPSYNVSFIGKAIFLEKSQTCPEAQKIMHVFRRCVGGTYITDGGETPPVTVHIFSKDGASILGPYYLSCGETISVPVDDREWGVYADSDTEVALDVWFTYE